MRIASINSRLKLLVGSGVVDVEKASDATFCADPQAIFDRWDEFRAWAKTQTESTESFDPRHADTITPSPRQIFAIGLNYREHAEESGQVVPDAPIVFTKYTSSLTGPVTEVQLPPEAKVDWEVELVAVIGKPARNVPTGQAWDYVAGLTVGQDLSERAMQMHGQSAQWCLAKSLPGFSPLGATLVTPDELENRDDLQIGCEIDGEVVQSSSTALMIYPIPALIAYLSSLLQLYPGDVIFTGTPAGVGAGRTPPRYLRAGENLRSWVEHLGTLDQHFVAAKPD